MVYRQLEDMFYSFLDWLDTHGIPAYQVHDWLEEHGIPPFPAFLGVVLIILGAGLFAFLHSSIAYNDVMITVTDSLTGEPVVGAKVTLYINGEPYDTQLTDSTGTVYFSSIPDGYYTVDVEASGYKKLTDVPIEDGAEIKLENTNVVASTLCIRVKDASSGEVVRGAEVIVDTSFGSQRATFDEDLLCYTYRVPLNTKGTITVSALGYKPKTISFLADSEEKDIDVALEPSQDQAPGYTITVKVSYNGSPARAKVYLKDIGGKVVDTIEVVGEGTFEHIAPGTYSIQVMGLDNASGLQYVSRVFYLDGDKVFEVDLANGEVTESPAGELRTAEEDLNKDAELEKLLEELKKAQEEGNEEKIKEILSKLPNYPQQDLNDMPENEVTYSTAEILKNIEYKVTVNGQDLANVVYIPAGLEDNIVVCASVTDVSYADRVEISVTYPGGEKNAALGLSPEPSCTNIVFAPSGNGSAEIVLSFYSGDKLVLKRKWSGVVKFPSYDVSICVRDPYGQPISMAKIEVGNRTVYTNAQGCSKLKLRLGSYSLHVSAQYFKDWEGNLDVFEPTSKDIVLQYENVDAAVSLQAIYYGARQAAALASLLPMSLSFSVTVPADATSATLVVQLPNDQKYTKNVSYLRGKSGEVKVKVKAPYASSLRQIAISYWLEVKTPAGTEKRGEGSVDVYLSPVLITCGKDGLGSFLDYPDSAPMGKSFSVRAYIGACRSTDVDYVLKVGEKEENGSFHLEPFDVQIIGTSVDATELGEIKGSLKLNEKEQTFVVHIVPDESLVCATLSWYPDVPTIGGEVRVNVRAYYCQDPTSRAPGVTVQLAGGLAARGLAGSCTTGASGTCTITLHPQSSGDLIFTCYKDDTPCSSLTPDTVFIAYAKVLRPEKSPATFVLPLISGVTSNADSYKIINNVVYDVEIISADIKCTNPYIQARVEPPASISALSADNITVSMWYTGDTSAIKGNDLGTCTVTLVGKYEDDNGNVHYAAGTLTLNVISAPENVDVKVTLERNIYVYKDDILPGVLEVNVDPKGTIYGARLILSSDDPDISFEPESIELGDLSSTRSVKILVRSSSNQKRTVDVKATLTYRLASTEIAPVESSSTSANVKIEYADAPISLEPTELTVVLAPDNNIIPSSSNVRITKSGDVNVHIDSYYPSSIIDVYPALNDKISLKFNKHPGYYLESESDSDEITIEPEVTYRDATGRRVTLASPVALTIHVVAFHPSCLEVHRVGDPLPGQPVYAEIINNCGIPVTCKYDSNIVNVQAGETKQIKVGTGNTDPSNNVVITCTYQYKSESYTFPNFYVSLYAEPGKVHNTANQMPACSNGGVYVASLPMVYDPPFVTTPALEGTTACQYALCGYEEISESVKEAIASVYNNLREILPTGAVRATDLGCPEGDWCPIAKASKSYTFFIKHVTVFDPQKLVPEGLIGKTGCDNLQAGEVCFTRDINTNNCAAKVTLTITPYVRRSGDYVITSQIAIKVDVNVESIKMNGQDICDYIGPFAGALMLDFLTFDEEGSIIGDTGGQGAAICIDTSSLSKSKISPDTIQAALREIKKDNNSYPFPLPEISETCSIYGNGPVVLIRYDDRVPSFAMIEYNDENPNKIDIVLGKPASALFQSDVETFKEKIKELFVSYFSLRTSNLTGCVGSGALVVEDVARGDAAGYCKNDTQLSIVPGVWYEIEVPADKLITAFCGSGATHCTLRMSTKLELRGQMLKIKFTGTNVQVTGNESPSNFQCSNKKVTLYPGQTVLFQLRVDPNTVKSMVADYGSRNKIPFYALIGVCKEDGSPGFLRLDFTLKKASPYEVVKAAVAPEGYPNIPSPEQHIEAAKKELANLGTWCKEIDGNYYACNPDNDPYCKEVCVWVPKWDVSKAKEFAQNIAGDGPRNYELNFLGVPFKKLASFELRRRALSDPKTTFFAIAAGTGACSVVTAICAGFSLDFISAATLVTTCGTAMTISQLGTSTLLNIGIPAELPPWPPREGPETYHVISAGVGGAGVGFAYTLRQYLFLRKIPSILEDSIRYVNGKPSLTERAYSLLRQLQHMQGFEQSPLADTYKDVISNFENLKKAQSQKDVQTYINNIKDALSSTQWRTLLKEFAKGAGCGVLGGLAGELARTSCVAASLSDNLPRLIINCKNGVIYFNGKEAARLWGI